MTTTAPRAYQPGDRVEFAPHAVRKSRYGLMAVIPAVIVRPTGKKYVVEYVVNGDRFRRPVPPAALRPTS